MGKKWKINRGGKRKDEIKMSEIITQCKLIEITGLRSVYSIYNNRLMYADSSRLQETLFINFDCDKPKATEWKREKN